MTFRDRKTPGQGKISSYYLIPSVTLGLILVASLVFSLCNAGHRFDAAKWRNVVEGASDYRARVVGDLVARRVLLGMNRGEVLALLGPSSRQNPNSRNDLRYWLGIEGGWTAVDSMWLECILENDRVVEVRVVKD